MFSPFKRQPYKTGKHTQTICRPVFDHFVGLALEGLSVFYSTNLHTCCKLMTAKTFKIFDQFHRNGESGFRIS